MSTQRSIGMHRYLALRDIAQAAEAARCRHITGLAGQETVYAAKLAQALAYLAAHAADSGVSVPPYVAADVAATGATSVAAAQAIVDAAAAFHAGPGPDIEQARRSGNLAVTAATTAEDVQLALDNALAALQAI